MNGPGSDTHRRLVSHGAAIFLIRALPAAAMAAVGIAFSHFLLKDLNGLYFQLWVYLAILLAVGCIGIPPFMLTHSDTSVNRWLLSVKARHVSLYAVWLVILGLAFLLMFHGDDIFSPWMLLSLFVTQVLILLVETYLIISRKFTVLIVLNFGYAAGFCGIHLAYLLSAFSFGWLLWSIVLLGAVKMLALAVIARRRFAHAVTSLRRRIISGRIRSQWLQLGIYDVSQVAFRWIDKLFISMVVGPGLSAIYFIGTTDVPFMAMLLSAAGNGLLQQMATGDSTHKSRIQVVNFSGATLARIVFPVFFFLFFFRKEFIEVVFSDKYLASVPLFAISVLALPLRAYNYTSILQNLNRVKIINLGALLDLCIAMGLAVPLFVWKGLPGVAFAFMISSYIQAIFYLVKTAKLLHCRVYQLIPWRQWLMMLIISGSLLIGLHELLARYFSLLQTLILGFAGMAAIITVAILPVLSAKKTHG